ncbi:MAG: PQQ-binding-like beta-propeller repeat protein [Phycisphaerales bacterium]|nr:MAG: PQQ-binding-like beta-propeller repeat protein [Phycisphaerales bacterium]
MYGIVCGLVLLLGAAVAAQPTTGQPASSQPATVPPSEATNANFCFVQVTDSHLRPHPASLDQPPALRGDEAIRWFCAEAGKPQRLEPFGMDAPAPSFVIHTGDLTESGVIDETWSDVERAFRALPVPMHYVPGDQDNTWVAMDSIMRAKYKADHYSFDEFGCHFVGLSSALLQEPLPGIDAAARWWLGADLAKVGKQTPVFIYLHHPPDSDEFAQPAAWARLHNVICDHNVVLLLYGHRRTVEHRNVDGFDAVCGGSTYGSDAGYNIISVKDGILRVAYRFFDQDKPMRKLLEKPVKPRRGPVLKCSMRQLEAFGVRGKDISLKPRLDSAPGKARYHVTIDGTDAQFRETGGTIRIPAAQLSNGGHTLILRAESADGKDFYGMRSARFFVDDRSIDVPWRRYLPASVKARPLTLNDPLVVVVPETTGTLRAINATTTVQMWEFQTAGALLSSPVFDGGGIVFGSGDGHVYRVSCEGSLIWKYAAGSPVYGSPVVADGAAYIGDNSGRLHAIDATTGDRKWVFERAASAIESRPTVMGDRVLFGAWDGHLRCVSAKDGTLVWKSPPPAGARPDRPAPAADCGPVVLGDRIFVCDSDHLLASYAADGKPGEPIASGISAIAASKDRKSFYARGLGERVVKFNAQGQMIWEAKVPGGRFPVEPTEHDGRVYVCSDTGLLSVLDAGSGAVRWQYQTTPGLYVMAPIAVDAEGCCYVIGMKGGIARIRGKRAKGE